jgi:acyl phosphate:glycerol-3-phosphate acyltransferase
MTIAVAIALGYAIGSVPFAFLIARWGGGPDVRLAGSGNVGASNVLRLVGRRAGALTALLDVAKGAAAVGVAWLAGGTTAAASAGGVAAIAGHIYPGWLRFRGGKGVATSFGVFAVLAPLAAMAALVLFGVALRVTRYVSVGSMLAAACLGPIAYAIGAPGAVTRAAFVSGCFVIFKHHGNLARLASGSERRIGDAA